MRSKILGGLLLGAGIMAPTVSWSLGLGDMAVLSAPGEPFRAQIPLRSVTAEDLDALQVRLAPATAFESIGVTRTPGVEQLSFRIKSGATPVVLVSSSRPLPEGSLHFLVELEWGGGKLVKDYLARMRYPESPVASPMLAQPAETTPLIAPVSRAPVAASGSIAPTAPRHASRPVPQPIGPGQQWSRVAIYGPVTGKDNLYRIASRMRSDSRLGMSQIMAALYQHNPDAFLAGNPDALRPGAVLKAPPLNLIQGMRDADAVRILTRRESRPSVQPLASATQAVPQGARQSKPFQSGAKPAPVVAQVAPGAAKQPEFYIRPAATSDNAASAQPDSAALPASVQALQEENLANKKAYELLSQTVTRLNQKVQEQQKLLLELQAQRDAALLNSPEALLKNPLMLLMVGSNALLLVLVLYLLWRQRRSNLDIAAAQASLRSMEKEKLLHSREQNRTIKRQKAEPQPVAAPAPVQAPAAVQVEPVAAPVTERAFASMESPEVDVLDQAELYLTYGRVQQAQEALESALIQQPGRKEIYVKLLDLYAKQSKLDDYQDLAERMRGRFGKDNPAWRGVMAQGALLFPGNPLFEDQPVVTAAPNVDSGFMELDLSDSSAADPMVAGHAFDDLAPALDLAGHEPSRPGVAAGDGNVIDFDFGSLNFDPATSQAGSRTLGASAEDSDDAAFTLDVTSDSGLAKAHEDVFAALDREFSALEEVVRPEADSPMDLSKEEGLFLDLDTAPATASSTSDNDLPDWDGMDTKLDLAKAYVDMGDSESARELLQEIAQQGDGRIRSEAQQLLAAIG